VWKKKEDEPTPTQAVSRPEPPSPPRAAVRRPDRAVIGATLRISGEISGEEELIIQGKIEGKIVVKGQGVTVGKSGKVKANIHARSIRVEGEVRGDLFGEQEIILEASGDVEGNLISPSVRLENGSRFKGSIDMERAKSTAAAPPVAAIKPGGLQTAAGRPGAEADSERKGEASPPGTPPVRSQNRP
jgi:cytoskeletal protein CcmA (bactofilin family)